MGIGRFLGMGVIQSVERTRCGTLASQIGKFRNGLLHSVGRFVIFDRGFNGRVFSRLIGEGSIQ